MKFDSFNDHGTLSCSQSTGDPQPPKAKKARKSSELQNLASPLLTEGLYALLYYPLFYPAYDAHSCVSVCYFLQPLPHGVVQVRTQSDAWLESNRAFSEILYLLL